MPTTTCTHCGASFEVAEKAIGRRARCGKCKQRFVVQADPAADVEIGDDPFDFPEDAAADDDPLGIGSPGDPLDESGSSEDPLDDPLGNWESAGAAPGSSGELGDPLASGPSVQGPSLPGPSPSASPAPPTTRGASNRQAAEKDGDPRRVRLVVGLIAAGVTAIGVVIVLLIGLAVWFAFSGGAEMLVGGSGATIVAAAREPQTARDSWVVEGPLPAGVDWKLSADPAPRSTGLKSSIPIGTNVTEVVFAAPDAAKAAALDYKDSSNSAVRWTPLDLRQDAPPTTTVTIRPAARVAMALGPGGDRLAVVGRRRDYQRPEQPDALLIDVWSTDGETIASLEDTIDKEVPSGVRFWTGFVDSNLLLVQYHDRLLGFDIDSGAQAYAVQGSFGLSPVFSAGRKYVAAFNGEGFDFYSSRDGAAVGKLPLPEAWFNPERLTYPGEVPGEKNRPSVDLGFDPEGRRAVVTSFDKEGGLYIGLLDLLSGKVTEAIRLPFSETQIHFDTPPIWLGERRLLFPNGAVVDLDLRTFLCTYKPSGYHRCVGRSPDGRSWRVAIDKKEPSKGNPRTRLGGPERLLVAASLPYNEDVQAFEEARKGFLWHPGKAIRIEAFGKGTPEQLQKLADTVAGAIAKEGFRVDPEAKTVLRIEDLGIEDAEVTGKLIEVRGGNWGLFEVLDGVANAVRFEVLEGGKPVMRLSDMGTSVEGTDSAAEDQAREELRTKLSKLDYLPRLYLRNAAGERIGRVERNAAQGLNVGIDGLEEPTREPVDRNFDIYALPEEHMGSIVRSSQ